MPPTPKRRHRTRRRRKAFADVGPSVADVGPSVADSVLESPDLHPLITGHLTLGDCHRAAAVCRLWGRLTEQTLDSRRLVKASPAARGRPPCARIEKDLSKSAEAFGGLCGPSFVGALPNGDVAVSDSYNHRVRILCGATGEQRCVLGDGAAALTSPSGVAVSGELVYVAEKWAHRVRCYRVSAHDYASELVASSGSGVEGASAGRLSHPMGLALSSDGGTLFVADSYNHRVVALDATTLAHRYAFGDAGVAFSSPLRRAGEAGALRYPVGLACHDGELFVADAENHRVAVYSEAGGFARSLGGGRGRAPGAMNEPEGVAIARGRLVVSEAAGCRLQVLSLDGAPQQVLDVTPEGCGRLAGLCCSADARHLWVEDFYQDTLVALRLEAPPPPPPG